MPEGAGSRDKCMNRRQFLKLSGLLAGLLALNPKVLLRAAANGSRPKVVHVHSSEATGWDFSTGWYGDYVAQGVVSEMVDCGAMELTGETSRAAAWQALIPDYVPGQTVAVKVNFNNAWSAGDSDNVIDALIEPVNAVITGLKDIGVAESDIWVYDAVRAIPTRFMSGCEFPGVQFSGTNINPQGFSTTEKVTFAPPAGGPSLADQGISNVLVNADYLINMPIMKKHRHAWVTLSFKNHFGTVEDCAALHGYTFPYLSTYRSDYSPLVDIYNNVHFVGKTVVTIADGLYGSRAYQDSEPEPWGTFGNQAPNSFFFSKDPVAIDSVMYDFLEAEVGVEVGGDDYLAFAAQEGLGVHEHRAPGASGPEEWYSEIDYVYLDVDEHVELSALWRDGTAYLSWTEPSHPGLAGYHICYASETGGDADQGASPIDVPDPEQLTSELTGLTMYSLYEVWIEAYDGSDDPLCESNHVPLLPTDIIQYIPLIMRQ